MSVIARQSTARTVTVGPVLDADGAAVTDGVVGDLKISKNGGAPAALNASATLTHRHTGFYSLALTASDLDTVGSAEVVIDDTTNACPMKVITVIEEAVYDALFAASATGALPVSAGGIVAASFGAGAIDAAAIATGAIDADAIADNAIDAGALAADCITAAKIADGAIDAATFAAGAIDAAAIAADAITAAKVADGTIDAATFAAGAITATVIATGAIDADALHADAVAEIVAGVWDESTAGNTTAGTFGAAVVAAGSAGDPWSTSLPGAYGSGTAGFIVGTNLNETVGSRATQTSVDDLPTNAELTAALNDLPTNAELATALDPLPTAAENAAAVWGAAARTLTAGTNIDGSTFSDIPWNSDWDAEVQSEVTDALTAALTEGYRSAGATGSVRDLLYELVAHLGESAISGTTKTLKKLDGSTTAKTYTLDDADTPTSITETT